MKIVGKSRDYYDGVAMPDAGDRIWVRTTETVTVERDRLWSVASTALDLLASMPTPPWQLGDAMQRTLISFCGRGYGALSFLGNSSFRAAFTRKNVESQFDRGPETYRRTSARAAYEELMERTATSYDPYPFNPDGWDGWLADHDGTELDDDLHRELDTPVIALVLTGSRSWLRRTQWVPTIIRNPPLRSHGMASRVDPYTAWQELDMYLGNQLARQDDPTDRMSDAVKRQARGFTDMSFKRRPGTHPNRKRKRRS
jgi:hypothetical protein